VIPAGRARKSGAVKGGGARAKRWIPSPK
jgi:hypothetical protein